MFTRALVFVFAALFAAQSVAARTVWFKNQCSNWVRPIIKNTAQGVTFDGGYIAPGATAISSVPENWSSGIMVGQTNSNQGIDCVGCTRLECDFSSPPYQNCNLSRVAGFNIKLGFGWGAPAETACAGATCADAGCPPRDAWNPNVDDGSSLRFCNIGGAGINVWFC